MKNHHIGIVNPKMKSQNEKRLEYGTARGWVNTDIIIILEWTIHLIFAICLYLTSHKIFLLKCWQCPFLKCYLWDEFSPLTWWKLKGEKNVSGPERMSFPPHGVGCQFPVSQGHLGQLVSKPSFIRERSQKEHRRLQHLNTSALWDAYMSYYWSWTIHELLKLNYSWVTTEAELFTLAGELVIFKTGFWWRNQRSEGTSQNASILDFF